MKVSPIIVFLVGCSFYLNSCCTEKYCLGIEDMNRIEFQGFDEIVLSDITLYTYSNSNYTTVTDSTQLYLSSNTNNLDYRYANLAYFLEQGNFYQLKLADNATYTIDSFRGKRRKCNTGFMCRDFYEILESYKVNGVKQEFATVRIYK